MVLDPITSKLREIWCAIVKDERSDGYLPPQCAAAVNPEGSGRGKKKPR